MLTFTAYEAFPTVRHLVSTGIILFSYCFQLPRSLEDLRNVNSPPQVVVKDAHQATLKIAELYHLHSTSGVLAILPTRVIHMHLECKLRLGIGLCACQ